VTGSPSFFWSFLILRTEKTSMAYQMVLETNLGESLAGTSMVSAMF
jgi:hypothetical protein